MAEGFKENERIMFIHFNDAFKIKADYKLIDELDDLLETHGFCAYSTSFSHSDYSFLEV